MRKFQRPSQRPPSAPKPKGLGQPDGLLSWLAAPAPASGAFAEHFATEQPVVALSTERGQLLLTAAYEDGWVYVRGENFEEDWYGSGRSLSAAVRDYLERVELEVAIHGQAQGKLDGSQKS